MEKNDAQQIIDELDPDIVKCIYCQKSVHKDDTETLLVGPLARPRICCNKCLNKEISTKTVYKNLLKENEDTRDNR